MKKVYKEVVKDNGTITFYGSNRWIKLHYAKPEWSEYDEPYFNYRGMRYYLSEFMVLDRSGNYPEYVKEFDGYVNDSYFSGVVIKYGEDDYGEEAVKAFTYIS